MPPGSFYKPKFFEFMKEESQACREGVGIIDMSSFSKIEIKVSRCTMLLQKEKKKLFKDKIVNRRLNFIVQNIDIYSFSFISQRMST